MHRVSQNICAPFVWLLWRSCGFNYLTFCTFLQARLQHSLRSCFSQSDTWLLFYGKETAKLVVPSKTALLLFFSNVKVN